MTAEHLPTGTKYAGVSSYTTSANANSRVEFCKFERGAGVIVSSSSPLNRPIASNRFALTHTALNVYVSQPVEVINNLFYWNYYGFYQRMSYATLTNNTFDENDYGCRLLLSYTGTPPYYTILHDNLFTSPLPPSVTTYGIDASTSSTSKVAEYSNAFFNVTYPYRLNGAASRTDWNDILLDESPFGAGKRGYEVGEGWFLNQTGRAVNGGSQSSCDAGVRVYTTHYDENPNNRSKDDGRVDIGYHNPFSSSVIFVDDSYTGGDGSYARPYQTIHEGWAAAGTGESVFVFPGTYGYGAAKSLSLNKPSVDLYGSGPRCCFIESVGTPSETNHPLVRSVGQQDIDFEGFTIRGRENEVSDDSGLGGGLHCTNCSGIALRYCVITDNDADYGAGIYAKDCAMVVERCIIHGNRASCGVQGGGIYVEGGSATITDCTLSGNFAGYKRGPGEDAGGGIACKSCSVQVTGTLLVNNMGGEIEPLAIYWVPAGGAYLEDVSSALVSECALVNNRASRAGAIWVVGGSSSSFQIEDSMLVANHAETGDGAGVLCQTSGHIAVTRCVISENSAPSPGGEGGGVYVSDEAVPSSP